jgi:hypothetical protein
VRSECTYAAVESSRSVEKEEKDEKEEEEYHLQVFYYVRQLAQGSRSRRADAAPSRLHPAAWRVLRQVC